MEYSTIYISWRMENQKFMKFQIRLMKLYYHYRKWRGSTLTENEIELEYVEKYSKSLRKINDILQKFKLRV